MANFMCSAILVTLAGFLSAASLVISATGRKDGADVYLVLDLSLKRQNLDALDRLGLREVGPEQGVLSRMIKAGAEEHKRLVDDGYWIIPAGALAQLCGVAFDT